MSKVSKLQRFGNLIAVIYDDGTKDFAYPATTAYIVHGTHDVNGTGGGGGGSGELALVSPLPTTFTGTDVSGDSITLNATQIIRMSQVCSNGSQIAGINRAAALIAGIAGMTESSLRNLSNPTYPETAGLPDIDGEGSDHDSVGIWQMRPASGWGTPTECATISYEVAAFFGGPGSPNNGSPAGLLDISGWQTMTPGQAAQAVEVSAFPDRYDNYVPFIDALLKVILVNG